jgi:AAA domain
VACLEAPEPVQVPAGLLRADGRSVYQRHGGVRFATHAQLTMEQRMLALARARNAPRMDRAEAARALGADLAQLDRALAGHTQDAQYVQGWGTRTGLRVDQAAAALSVLTDGKRVSVLNAPAGSGKTWVLAAVGRAWTAAGRGRVIGIMPSQSARNTLAAGIPECYNCAQFLGHLPGRRGARSPIKLQPGDLVLMDEASMIANPDLADVIAQATAADAKVILAGDTQQLQAVENGGGLSLLAGALGFLQLAEPARFRAAWEQAASLRLRDGDTTVLADYDQHARIRGGEPEQMMDAAASDYLALALDSADVLLMAADHALRRELSRRIRDDLIRLGIVSAGPTVRVADGAAVSPGDLIICTKNDHSVQAGEPGRTLSNGDLLRIDAITGAGLVVRRALDADPQTGQRRWTDRTFLSQDFRAAELGCAVTDHVAQGRTVTAGLAVITGTEDRQHAHVAMSRGTDVNMAYVFTVSPKLDDPMPGRARPRSWPATTGSPPSAQANRHRGRDQGRARSTGWRAGARRPAAIRLPDPAAGPGRRRSPGRSARDLDRRDRVGSRPALPGSAPGVPAAGAPARARPPGEMAGGPCAPRSWLAWTLGRYWPRRSASGTWPGPATRPRSSMPGSGTGSAPSSRLRRACGRPRSPPSPTLVSVILDVACGQEHPSITEQHVSGRVRR